MPYDYLNRTTYTSQLEDQQDLLNTIMQQQQSQQYDAVDSDLVEIVGRMEAPEEPQQQNDIPTLEEQNTADDVFDHENDDDSISADEQEIISGLLSPQQTYDDNSTLPQARTVHKDVPTPTVPVRAGTKPRIWWPEEQFEAQSKYQFGGQPKAQVGSHPIEPEPNIPEYQEGGMVKDPNIKGPIGFFNSYYHGPEYKKRYLGSNLNNISGYEQSVEDFDKAAGMNRVAHWSPSNHPGSSAVGFNFLMNLKGRKLAFPSIHLNQKEADKLGTDLTSAVYPHEYTHNIRGLNFNEEMEFAYRNKNSTVYDRFMRGLPYRNINYPNSFSGQISQFSHDNQPSENYADLNALRFMMYKQGIYDTRKGPMTKEHLQKALNDPWIKKQLPSSRLFQMYEPDDIIRLNNNIGGNNNTGSPEAQYGGNTLYATDYETQRIGLNNPNFSSAYFPMTGSNMFRGLDSYQPVAVTDGKKYQILKGPKDRAKFKGAVYEHKI